MERSVVHAEIPETELARYTIALRSLTAGCGRFTRDYLRHDVVPANIAATVRGA
jgi:elongation factor G